MRDTNYATELGTSTITLPDGSEARLERLKMKPDGSIRIRFSWWKDNNMALRPLDLSETELMTLLAKAMREGVLFPDEGGVR